MTWKSTPFRKIALRACQGLLFSLMASCAMVPAHAQFLGNVGLQTGQQTLATNTACTGSAQTFFPTNAGLSQHFISIASSGTTFMQAEIDGVDTNGDVYRISDELRSPNTLYNSLVAYGYFPKIQIQIDCSSGGTFTLNYSGSQAAYGPIVGSYQLGQIDKAIINGASASANSIADQIQAPFGNQSGTISFSYLATGPAGSQIVVECLDDNGPDAESDVFYLPTTAQVYTFRVPPRACPFVVVEYVSGGASTATYNLEYVFGNPGFPTGASTSSPAQLAVNSLTEPGSGTSALSNIMDVRSAKEATLMANCTAGPWAINVQTYDEFGSTPLALVTPVTAITAGTDAILQIGSEANPSTNTGTLSTSALLRLPLSTLAFSFTNGGSAGTCTARLFLNY